MTNSNKLGANQEVGRGWIGGGSGNPLVKNRWLYVTRGGGGSGGGGGIYDPAQGRLVAVTG